MERRTLLSAFIAFVSIFSLGCSKPSFEELQSEAHTAYELALEKEPYQLSDLPRVGETKGDDYNNCLNKGFAEGLSGGRAKEVDFCKWHSGIGSWAEYHNNYRNWLNQQNKKASEQSLYAARASAEKAGRKPRKPPYPGAKCWNEPEYNAVLDQYFDNLVGDVDCVMADMMSDDKMLAGYWLEDRSLFIVINNIRSGRDIDLKFYGFSEDYKQSVMADINDISDVKFVKRYSVGGAAKSEVERKLVSKKTSKESKNRVSSQKKAVVAPLVAQKTPKPISTKSSVLEENMRMKDVRKLLGKPDQKLKDSTDKKIEIWVYKDGTRVTFKKKGLVHRLINWSQTN